MEGKICMVTGATAGIGAETAKGLARLRATVVVVGHNAQRGESAVERIRQQTGNPDVEFMLADLSSQNDIRGLAARFKRNYSRLDVLVNNAGIVSLSRLQNPDGTEMTFAVNHLGYFVLTNLLLDTLVASAPARIVNVSSAMHWQGKIDLTDLNLRHSFNPLKAYSNSKLANVLFTYELARRLEGSGVCANALHPGAVRSNLIARNGRLFKWTLQALFNLQAISAEKGARTSLYLAASPEVDGVGGRYFDDCTPRPSSPASYNTDIARGLWQASAEMTGLVDRVS